MTSSGKDRIVGSHSKPSGWLTKADVAALLSVTPATVMNHVKRGLLPQPTRVGTRLLRWRAADIEKSLTRR